MRRANRFGVTAGVLRRPWPRRVPCRPRPSWWPPRVCDCGLSCRVSPSRVSSSPSQLIAPGDRADRLLRATLHVLHDTSGHAEAHGSAVVAGTTRSAARAARQTNTPTETFVHRVAPAILRTPHRPAQSVECGSPAASKFPPGSRRHDMTRTRSCRLIAMDTHDDQQPQLSL